MGEETMTGSIVNDSRYPEFDVMVAGGGMAGVSAAIAAARTGARTVLVDKAGWLGGMGITGATGIHSFFNIYLPQPGLPEGTERRKVVGGIAEELIQRVRTLNGGIGHVRMERGGDFVSMLTPVEPEVFKYAAALTVLGSGARMLLHTVVDEVRATDKHIDGVVVWNKAGRSLIRAKTYVDCTGDGDLAAYGGAEWVQGWRTGFVPSRIHVPPRECRSRCTCR
jgi:flavin-dependent dehydrogenase